MTRRLGWGIADGPVRRVDAVGVDPGEPAHAAQDASSGAAPRRRAIAMAARSGAVASTRDRRAARIASASPSRQRATVHGR